MVLKFHDAWKQKILWLAETKQLIREDPTPQNINSKDPNSRPAEYEGRSSTHNMTVAKKSLCYEEVSVSWYLGKL
jgi:hypothetical protein